MRIAPVGLVALLGLALLGVGCKARNPDPRSAGEGAEPKVVSHTVWGERHEHFAEHAPLVAGQPTTFAAHVTDLVTFEAVATGTLAVVAYRGGEEVARSAAVPPARPGIFRPALVVPSAGSVELRVSVSSDGASDEMVLGRVLVHASAAAARAAESDLHGDQGHSEHGEHEHEEHHEHGEEASGDRAEEGIVFLKEQQWRLGLRTALAARRTLVETMRVPGRVIARPGGRAVVAAPVAGVYAAPLAARGAEAAALPQVGQTAAAGQPLGSVAPILGAVERVQLLAARADLESRALEAEAALAHARAEDERAAAWLARLETMHAARAASARELDEARFAHQRVKLDVGARERVQRPFVQALAAAKAETVAAIPVAASIAGQVAAARVTPGERVEAGQALFELVDLDAVWIETDIPEADLGRLPPSPRAVWVPAAEPGASAAAPLRFVALAPEIDDATRSARAIFAADAARGALRLSAAVDVVIDTRTATDALAVPEAALVDEDGRATVYVQLGGESFARREVMSGLRAHGFVEVKDGLRAGERVVVDGAYAVRLQSLTSAMPEHGHEH